MSLPTLVIGTKKLSSWSLRPWLVLKHLDISFEELELPLDTPEYHRRIGAYSPTRRVPVLLDGNHKVWDSLAICEYANDLAGGGGLPSDRFAKGHARSVCAEMHAGFRELRRHMPMNIRSAHPGKGRTPGVENDIARIVSIWESCRSCFGAGGDLLFGSFTCGLPLSAIHSMFRSPFPRIFLIAPSRRPT